MVNNFITNDVVANDWAKLTLELHAKDKRPFLYSLEQLDNFKTHDQLWNAAQIQMRVEGKMHGIIILEKYQTNFDWFVVIHCFISKRVSKNVLGKKNIRMDC
jgi:hypothetical protein